MAGKDIYGLLAEHFMKMPIGIVRTDEGHEREIFKHFFSENEAEAALHLGPNFQSIVNLCFLTGRKRSELEPLYEGMAKKGGILASGRGAARSYALQPFYPGLFEEIFIKPEQTPEYVELAKNIEGMFAGGMLNEIHGGETPWSRVIMVEERITGQLEVFPYERVSNYIEKYDDMALMPCHCRNRNRMLGKGCDAPADNCMVFGNGAKWAVRHGFGQMVSRDEMYHKLRETEEHGLIHCTNNSSEEMLFICNCCGCCCYVLFGITRANLPTAVAKSHFILTVDGETCSGCGTCVERCHVNALELEEGVAQLEAARCIGCGICNLTCPTESLSMARRDEKDFAVPRKTWAETIASIAEEKGRI